MKKLLNAANHKLVGVADMSQSMRDNAYRQADVLVEAYVIMNGRQTTQYDDLCFELRSHANRKG
jgi:hypothetical protein